MSARPNGARERPEGFLEQLDWYGAAARRAAIRYLPDDQVSEHLWRPATEYLRRGGKGLRPALCLATCEAVGGDIERALPSAAALELFHTAFLVHDDIEDDSELRRGSPTLHLQYGRALAINAGDGLAVFALSALGDNRRILGRSLAARLYREFEFMARLTVDGQAQELGWQRDAYLDLTPDDYLDLIMRKTCWYTTLLPLRVGALIGSESRLDPRLLLRFGFLLGAAFQIRDDVLNLTGSPDAYGKDLLGDLREGKRTLMLIHLAAAASPPDRARVARYLLMDRAARTTEVIAEILALMTDYGSVEFAEQFGRGISCAAFEAFEESFVDVPDSAARRFVGALVSFMVDRES